MSKENLSKPLKQCQIQSENSSICSVCLNLTKVKEEKKILREWNSASREFFNKHSGEEDLGQHGRLKIVWSIWKAKANKPKWELGRVPGWRAQKSHAANMDLSNQRPGDRSNTDTTDKKWCSSHSAADSSL